MFPHEPGSGLLLLAAGSGKTLSFEGLAARILAGWVPDTQRALTRSVMSSRRKPACADPPVAAAGHTVTLVHSFGKFFEQAWDPERGPLSAAAEKALLPGVFLRLRQAMEAGRRKAPAASRSGVLAILLARHVETLRTFLRRLDRLWRRADPAGLRLRGFPALFRRSWISEPRPATEALLLFSGRAPRGPDDARMTRSPVIRGGASAPA
ncbi:MAG TPA: hypothetical protein VGL47_25785 [Amycolatopsis sp.]|uniref:hypothetical protein n=1 Tax=Amycolatopsis sp. TaxID=37632 RepID=UPI002F3F61D7